MAVAYCPEIVEYVEEVAGIYFRSVLLPAAYTIVPQHEHDHDHATLVCAGRARLWVDGQFKGDYAAGHAVEIKAGHKHFFQSLEKNTRLACVHDVDSAMSIKERGL